MLGGGGGKAEKKMDSGQIIGVGLILRCRYRSYGNPALILSGEYVIIMALEIFSII